MTGWKKLYEKVFVTLEWVGHLRQTFRAIIRLHLNLYKGGKKSDSNFDIWAMSWENLFMPYANNKGADQPAHPRSLISTFVVHCLDTCSMISLVSISEISSLQLVSGAAHAGLCLTWSKPRRQVFSWWGSYCFGFKSKFLFSLKYNQASAYVKQLFNATTCTKQCRVGQPTVMILSFRTDRPGQTVQTQIRLLPWSATLFKF